jgi:hypothetical protein
MAGLLSLTRIPFLIKRSFRARLLRRSQVRITIKGSSKDKYDKVELVLVSFAKENKE